MKRCNHFHFYSQRLQVNYTDFSSDNKIPPDGIQQASKANLAPIIKY